MRRNPILPTLALCALLSACVGPIGNERVDWAHGARHGRVLALLTPQAAAPDVQACLGTGAVLADMLYVKLRYRGTRLHHTIVTVVPAGLALRPGDEVELRPGDCAQGRLARIERVLPPLTARPGALP